MFVTSHVNYDRPIQSVGELNDGSSHRADKCGACQNRVVKILKNVRSSLEGPLRKINSHSFPLLKNPHRNDSHFHITTFHIPAYHFSQRTTPSRMSGHSSNSSTMRPTTQAQPSNKSLPSYNAATSTETLPEYTLPNLSPPTEAHTRVTHTQAADPAPTVDYIEAQPHLAFDVEANIARNNAYDVSAADFSNFSCTFLCQLRCSKVLPQPGRRQ